METPKSSQRPTRNHTPHLSDRKKNLFPCIPEGDVDDLLSGITPLNTPPDCTLISPDTNSLLKAKVRPQFICYESESTPTRRSLRLKQKSISPPSNVINSSSTSALCPQIKNGKENRTTFEGTEEHLQILFSTFMRLSGMDSLKENSETFEEHILENVKSPEKLEDSIKESREIKKRPYLRSKSPPACSCLTKSPERKLPKLCSSLQEMTPLPISTKSFYPAPKKTFNMGPTRISCTAEVLQRGSPRTRRQERRLPVNNINKGVRHMIRRRSRISSGAIGRQPTSAVDIDRILKNVRNERLHNLINSKRQERAQIEKVHSIFRAGQDPIKMARPLSALSNTNDTNNNHLITIYNDSSHNKRYLSEQVVEADFSDIENSDGDCELSYTENKAAGEEMVEEVIPLQRFDASMTKKDGRVLMSSTHRKFFKSGHATSTRKEMQITENIRASISNGKFLLVEQKKRAHKRIKIRSSAANGFADEQATVNAILKNMDDSALGDQKATDSKAFSESASRCKPQQTKAIDKAIANALASATLGINYSEFRKRLPYKTTDPELIEQQHLLLDFLITNNICTEENFNIFIADPENHKEKAADIVDQVIVVINEQTSFRDRIPYNTCDPELTAQQHRFLDFLIKYDICSEENFDIFIGNYNQRFAEAETIISTIRNDSSHGSTLAPTKNMDASSKNLSKISEEMSCTSLMQKSDSHISEHLPPETVNSVGISEKLFPIFYPGRCKPIVKRSSRRVQRNWIRGEGDDQYQIDAGQKGFGAQQCKQCGLIYSIHEPEEEKLHRDYHASLHLLRFKAWIDEDAVAFFREWGVDGRILRVTESSNIKRRERVIDVLKVVDKELGYSSYIVPKIYVAYLAVRKYQIVGLCLVHPLGKAHKYIIINGVDCCTEEEFEAKCGISRIWVSPLHRHLGIGTKLVHAVQLNTIFGEEITLDKIAFSAPTETGKIFAQKVTQTENFLVYE